MHFQIKYLKNQVARGSLKNFLLYQVKRKRLDCPKCDTKGLSRLSNHLSSVHDIAGTEKKDLLSKARTG